MINIPRVTEFVKILHSIPSDAMFPLMYIKPENFAQLNSFVRVLDFIPDEMQWLKQHVDYDFRLWGNFIVSTEAVQYLITTNLEILQELHDMPQSMREALGKMPVAYATTLDREVDVICCTIRPLIERANLILKKDGNITTYIEGLVQYIVEVLRNLKKTEVTYGVQLAFSLASEIVIQNRLSGAFGGSNTPENVLDYFFALIQSSIQKAATFDIMNEVLATFDIGTARNEVSSEYFNTFRVIGVDTSTALESIYHRPVDSQNKHLYEQHVKKLKAITKNALLDKKSAMIEISQRLYGDASYAIQLVHMIDKTNNPYKVYEALDNYIKYLLNESIFKDYIGRIRNIPIKDAVLYW